MSEWLAFGLHKTEMRTTDTDCALGDGLNVCCIAKMLDIDRMKDRESADAAQLKCGPSTQLTFQCTHRPQVQAYQTLEISIQSGQCDTSGP